MQKELNAQAREGEDKKKAKYQDFKSILNDAGKVGFPAVKIRVTTAEEETVTVVTTMLGMATVISLFAIVVYIVPDIKHGLHLFHQEITNNRSISKRL
jgi:hypothetical protein